MGKKLKQLQSFLNPEPLPTFYEGKLLGLRKPIMSLDQYDSPERPDYRKDFKITEASDNTNDTGKVLNIETGKKEDIESSGFMDKSGTGYLDYLYFKPSIAAPKEDASDDEKTSYKRLMAEFNKGKISDDVKYDFLVNSVDPETGKPLLGKVSGTWKEITERGFRPFNKWGVPHEDDNAFADAAKTFANSPARIVETVLGAGKFLADVMHSPDLFEAQRYNDPVWNWLDKAHSNALRNSEFGTLLTSEQAKEFGTVNWAAAGTTQTVLSLAEFGAYGRGISAGIKGARAIGKPIASGLGKLGEKLGVEILTKEALTNEAIGTLSKLGSSSIIGYGTAYSNAKQSGLSDEEAMTTALITGTLTSAAELYFGPEFDDFLAGGGIKAASDEIISKVAKMGATQQTKRTLTARIPEMLVETGKRLKRAVPESAEEIVQSIAEQGSQLTFNALFKDDVNREAGKGLFHADEFSFTQVVEAGFFGFLAPLPFSTSSNYGRAIQAVQEGKKNQVKANMNDNLTKGKITPKQYQQGLSELDKISDVVANYDELFKNIQGTGKVQGHLKKSLIQLIETKQFQREAIDKKLKGLGNIDLNDVGEKATEVRKFIEGRNKVIDDLNKKIDEFKDVNHLNKLAVEFKNKQDIYWKNRNDKFQEIAELMAYEGQSSESDIVNKVNNANPEYYKNRTLIRNAKEAGMALKALREGKIKPEMAVSILTDIVTNNLQYSTEVNTPENKEILTSALGENGLMPTQEEFDAFQGTPEAAELQQKLAQLIDSEEVSNLTTTDKTNRFERIKTLLRNSDKFGIDKKNLGLLSQKSQLLKLLGKDASAALRKLLDNTGLNPNILLHQDQKAEGQGAFHINSNTMAISADLNRIEALQGKQKLTESEAKELTLLQKDLLHKTLHELSGHGMLDRQIYYLHSKYVDAVKNQQKTLEAYYFERMLNLAELTFQAFKDTPSAQTMYFMKHAAVYSAMPEGDVKLKQSVILVKEFMAESTSNEKMQRLMAGFHINEPNNAQLVGDYYNYKVAAKFTPKSLWDEVVSAFKGLFSAFGNLFTKQERTILSEAIALGSGADFDQYAIGKTYPKSQRIDVDQMTMAEYNGINLLNDRFGKDVKSFIEEVTQAFRERNIKLGLSLIEFSNKIEASLVNELNGDNEIVKDTLSAVYFEKSDTFMTTWKMKDAEGNVSRERRFFNKYGENVNLNTNARNTAEPLTVQKSVWEAFNLPEGDKLRNEKLEIFNNVRQAAKEDFVGEVTFSLDENYEFIIGNKTVRGAKVDIVYHYEDGTTGVIGHAHDLSKVRLARYIKNGSQLKARVKSDATDGSNNGSQAYMKLDENGNVLDAKKLTTENIPDGYVQDYMMNPSLALFFHEDSIIPDEAQAVADSVDTLTPQDSNLEPKITQADLSNREAIIENRVTEKFFIDNKLISFYSTDQWGFEPGTAEQVINYYREGLVRSARRESVVFGIFEETDIAKNLVAYTDVVKAKIQSEVTDQDVLSKAELLGFETSEELTQFLNDAAYTIFSEMKGGISARNGEDWSGKGSNPSGRVSAGIKIALEAESYEFDGSRFFLDYDRAKYVLATAGHKAKNYSDIVKNLRKGIEAGDFAGEQTPIAKAIYGFMTREWTNSKAAEFFEGAKNSFSSQVRSFKKLGGVHFDFSEQDNPDGLTMRMYHTGDDPQTAKKQAEILGKLNRKLSDIRDIATKENKSTKEVLHAEIDNHFRNFMRKKLIDRGLAADLAAQEVEKLLKKKDGNPSNNLALLRGAKLMLTDAELNLKGTTFNDLGIFNRSTSELVKGVAFDNLGLYETAQSRVEAILDFLDIKVPESLFTVRRNPEFTSVFHKLYKENKPLREIKDATKGIPYNKFRMVVFEKNDGKGGKTINEHPFLTLAIQMIDWTMKDIELNVSGSKLFEEATVRTIAKELLIHEGNYRAPEFYLNNQGEKEWAYKTRSNEDTLFDNLQEKGSKLFKSYRKSPLYKDSTILDSIEANNFQPIEFMLTGLNSFYEENPNVTFENAGDMDFLSMNIAGFIADSNAINNGDSYYHIADVPSDKPRNLIYKLQRLHPSVFKSEFEKIIKAEQNRFDIATKKWNEAIAEDGTIKNQDAFNKLVPGVHYVESGNKLTKGWIFDKKNYFYEGDSSGSIHSRVENEAITSYKKWTSKGFIVPVNPKFLQQARETIKDAKELDNKIKSEQQRIYKEWYYNYVINRFHLTMLTMGDYIFYKPKDFVDLNKRQAGTRAPFMKGEWKRPKISVALMRDVGIDDNVVSEDSELFLFQLELKDGKQVLSERKRTINSKRTDAQGYLTEDFAAEIREAYGTLSGYEKIFKPVMFGVSQDKIDEGQPLYLKLSLSVLPRPTPENDAYYKQYPKQLHIAQKLYARNIDFMVFNTGVKSGVNTLNNLMDKVYNPIEFDSDLFGMQNNPYHDPNSDENFLSGLVQMTKQLGDNGNAEIMKRYHNLEASLLEPLIDDFFKTQFLGQDNMRQSIIEALEGQDHADFIRQFLKGDVNVLDNPVVSRYSENILNAMLKAKTELFRKNGEKLVNISDLGLERPPLDQKDTDYRFELLENVFGITPDVAGEYNTDLAWLGPRRPQDLNFNQLKKIALDYAQEKISLHEQYILDKDGNVMIFPADVIVPPTNEYNIGTRIIATRIPTSKPSSSIPGEVVGFLHPSQGNGIVVGKHGTGILGFDFDVDGLFVWRERNGESKKYPHKLNVMFNIAYGVLTSPANYNNMTSPTDTSKLSELAEMYASKAPAEQFSKFSPDKQIQFKRDNGVGKGMIGVAANYSGIHSIFSQYAVSLNRANEYYLYDGEELRNYPEKSVGGEQISDSFSELMNAAADNAKLQLLSKLNINFGTANVLMDMIAHGIDLEYAVHFINQPIIKEYVDKTEIQNSASYKGEIKDVAKQLMESVELMIRSTVPGYEFDPKNELGESTKPLTTMTISGKKGLRKVSEDVIPISQSQLEENLGLNINNVHPSNLEYQLHILQKFKHYESLARKTKRAGKLVTMTSKYPKTFLEAYDLQKSISQSFGFNGSENPPMDLGALFQHEGYKLHFATLNELISRYADYKLYATEDVLKVHDKHLNGLPMNVQQKVANDFLNYFLTGQTKSDNANDVYNLSTSSLTGSEIKPFDFVHGSAKIVEDMKKNLTDNEFLKVLTINQAKNNEPAFISSRLEYDIDPKLMAKIHEAFRSLPENYIFTYYDKILDENISIQIPSTKDLLLGHLLHTKGMLLGGFSFSKVLPPEVVHSFDKVINQISLEVDDPKIHFFFHQASLNHPEIVKEISDEDIALLEAGQKFEDDPSYGVEQSENALYRGGVKRSGNGNNEVIEFNIDNTNIDHVELKKFKMLNIIKAKNTAGKVVLWKDISVSKKSSVRTYIAMTDKPLRNVKQYNFNSSLHKLDHFRDTVSPVTIKVPEAVDNIGGVPMVNSGQVDTSVIHHVIPFKAEDAQAIRNGAKTGLSVPNTEGNLLAGVRKGAIVMLSSGTENVLVQATRDSYALANVYDTIKESGVENPEQRLIEGWAGVQGVSPDTLSDSKNVKVYQGTKGEVDDRKFNYYTTSKDEASQYGDRINEIEISLDGFLRKRTENGYTEEYEALNEEFIASGNSSFDILDNSPSGMSNQEKFFQLAESKGYKGFTELIDGVLKDENNYAVTFSGVNDQRLLKILPLRQIQFEYVATLDRAGNVMSWNGVSEYNNDFDFLDRNSISPDMISEYNNGSYKWIGMNDNTVSRVAQVLFHDFIGIAGNIQQWEKHMDKPYPNSQNPMILNGKQITFQEWLDYNVDAYTTRKDELLELYGIISRDGYLNSLSLEQLSELNRKVDSRFNVADGLLKKDYAYIFTSVKNAYSERLVNDVLKKHVKAGFDFDQDQKDIGFLDLSVQAITDFGEKSAGLQALGHITQRAFSKSERTAQQVLAKMNTLMSDVLEKTYAHEGKGFTDRLNIFKKNEYTRKAFDWMIERLANGKATGRFIARFQENEKYWKEKAFEKFFNAELQKEIYVISSRTILNMLSKSDLSFLNSAELDEFRAIVLRYKRYIAIPYDSLSEKEKRQRRKDSGAIRMMWVKRQVSQKDSEFFKNLKRVIANDPDSTEGKLAAAQLRLYDFIYHQANSLMFSNEFTDYTIERALMPQVQVSIIEAMTREKGMLDKLRSFYERFVKKDKDQDAEYIATDDNLIIRISDSSSFEKSAKVPLRTVNPLKDFASEGSTDVYSILKYHFVNLINTKHLSPVLSDLHAMYDYYDLSPGGKNFKNTKEYIKQFAEQYILNKGSQADREVLGKTAKALKNVVILQFLGLAPLTSLTNLIVGLSEDFKVMIGKHGIKQGTEMMQKGFSRMFAANFEDLDTILFDKKAVAILRYYGIDTFTESEVEKLNSWAGQVQDMMLILQSKGESVIWGVGLLAQMSDQEWDNFDVDTNGALVIKNPEALRQYSQILNLPPFFEHKINIGNVQGKYFIGGKRLLKNKPLLNHGLVFKGWIFDYFRSRFMSKRINMFSKEDEGYYRSSAKLLTKNIRHTLQVASGKEKFTPLELQSLRMVMWDLFMLSTLSLMHLADFEEDETAYDRYLAKLSRQIFFQFYPGELIRVVKQPFAALHDIEMGAKALEGMMEGNPEKFGKAFYFMLPGRQIIEGGKNIAEDE